MRNGPIYENAVFAASADPDQLGEQLTGLVDGYRTDAGIADARLFRSDDDEPGFVVQLSFTSNEAIDEFLGGRATQLEQEIEAFGGEDTLQSTRVLREDQSQNLPGESHCRNCGAPLRGQYCGQCGQRARSRLISLWELIRDAFGDLFELDSRLWQTLIPLLVRPGRLTFDYLQGKRARFMPPFRMYLVMSLLFFLVAFFNPREEFAFLYEPEIAAESDEDREFDISIADEDLDETDCEFDIGDIEHWPEYFQRRLTEERLARICRNTQADDGASFVDKLVDSIPAALIILLPLMALALQILYPLSRRYYVEHLLFFVHFHAFFFLILSLQILWARLIAALGLNEAIGVLPIVASSFYIPVYLFKAMRRVYGQGFFMTFFKYSVLLVVYTAGFGLTMLLALLTAAFSME
ncbi:MAG: DUF3667 domain-containing protein [Pseudomonadota bacterium]